MVCKLIKYAFFIPCSTTSNEKETAKLLFDTVVSHVALPTQIISDRDTRWRNDFWKQICAYMGSKRALTTAYHTQADGQSEILNQTLEVAIRAFSNFDRYNCCTLLPRLSYAYNNTPHTATGQAPSYLLYGFKPKEPLAYLHGENPADITRPTFEELTKDDSKEFIEEFEGIRQAAKDALRRAQFTFEKYYNKSHLPFHLEAGEQSLSKVKPFSL